MTDERDWQRIDSPRDRPAGKLLADNLLPQQETLAHITAVVRHAGEPVEQICLALAGDDGKPVDPRIVDYYRANARLLGFLDRHNVPTPTGRALLRLPRQQQIQRMAYAFEASAVGKAWLAFHGCVSLEDLDKQASKAKIADFVRHYRREHGMSDEDNETATRRAGTLRSWLTAFVAARQQVPLPEVEGRPRLSDAELPSKSLAILDTVISGKVIEHLAEGSRDVRVATAYFSLGGYCRIAARLDAADMFLLVGNDERSGNDITFLLQQFTASLRQRYDELATNLGGRRDIIRKLYDQLVRGRVRIRRFEAKKHAGLHAKVYIFDHERAYLGSANLTSNGLASNIECGRIVLDRDEAQYLEARFNHYFERAVPFSEPLLREIEKSWALWETVDPELMLLKILDLLFGRIQSIDGRSYQLAHYQQAIVATVMRQFESQRRVLLIAPTGIGKTLMGAYVAAALQKQDLIDRVVLVSKNQSMRDMWVRTLRSFRIYNDCIRTYDLERVRDGVAQDPKLAELFDELGPRDLIIVDECHHYRRRRAQRQVSLEELLSRSLDSASSPRTLLMTATPISTGIENLQTLVDMATPDGPRIHDVTDIARYRGVVNVSLGQVLRDFGVPKGTHVGLELQGELRFFPKLDLRTVPYPSDMDEVYEALSDMDFTLSTREGTSVTFDLEEDDEEAEVEGRHGFIRALIARRAESSLPALEVTLNRLEARVKMPEIRPSAQSRVLGQIERLRAITTKIGSKRDRKLKALLDLLRRLTPGTKVIVFTEYIPTADYLAEQIRQTLESSKVAIVTGELAPDERRNIFCGFAPIAQQVTSMPAKQYDVLVATDAISEGENLQDAKLVINYDLNWTPLRLIQRVGRVNRFTEDKRTVSVRNFFPGSQTYEAIVSLRARLQRRGQQVLALSGVDYASDGQQTPAWLAKQTVGAVADLYAAKRKLITWDELVEDAHELPSTQVPTRIWAESAVRRKQARQIPDGAHACGCGQNPGVYVLLEVDGRKVAVFRDERSGKIRSAPQPCSHEELLALVLDVVPADYPVEIVELDSTVDGLVEQWLATEGSRSEAEVTVLAVLEIRKNGAMQVVPDDRSDDIGH